MNRSEEANIVKGCQKGKSKYQRMLYDTFAPKMYPVCLRYCHDQQTAQDVLQDAFIKVFGHIKSFTLEGSLEGWIRRIVVNTAINVYRSKIRKIDGGDIELAYEESVPANAIDAISEKELLGIISQLPDGYRLVFSLYAIDGYSHKEIADQLGISESSSRSQLTRARKTLMLAVEQMHEKSEAC